jgi:hypothetical protein
MLCSFKKMGYNSFLPPAPSKGGGDFEEFLSLLFSIFFIS